MKLKIRPSVVKEKGAWWVESFELQNNGGSWFNVEDLAPLRFILTDPDAWRKRERLAK